jgi:hypothetical protein
MKRSFSHDAHILTDVRHEFHELDANQRGMQMKDNGEQESGRPEMRHNEGAVNHDNEI